MLRAFATKEDGVAAIEAALILPLVILLVMGTLEASFTFYTYTEMQHRTRDFVRRVAVGSLTPTQAKADLGSSLPSWTSEHAEVDVSQTHPSDPALNIITASISIPIRYANPLPFFSDRIDGVVTAANAMKQEKAP